METTIDIVAEIQNGNAQVFEQVFKAHYGPLCGYANKLTKDLDEAEEIVQAVFFKVWERRADLEITVSVKAYLYRAVHNACLNQLKHEKVKQAHANHVKATETEAVEADSLVSKESNEEIMAAIEALPEKCKEVFVLNRFDGLKYKEVAELLGISEKTVENQMGKALKVLKGKLAHYLRSIIPWIIFFLTDVGGNAG